jgi:hypothetical protein
MVRPLVTKILRRTAFSIGGVTVTGTAAITSYASTERGLGLRRELKFWGSVAPVVFDYWWHSSPSSPLIKYQKFRASMNLSCQDEMSQCSITQNESSLLAKEEVMLKIDCDGSEADDNSDTSADLVNKLHKRNASRIFQTILDLGGLYIKLGQVLSVTALPIPIEYRELFRTLQSDVPGHEKFEKVIKPTIEKEIGPLEDIFESVEEFLAAVPASDRPTKQY